MAIGETEWGFGGVARVGKEWRIGTQHMMGVVAHGGLSVMPDKDDGSPIVGKTLTLAASMSMN